MFADVFVQNLIVVSYLYTSTIQVSVVVLCIHVYPDI